MFFIILGILPAVCMYFYFAKEFFNDFSKDLSLPGKILLGFGSLVFPLTLCGIFLFYLCVELKVKLQRSYYNLRLQKVIRSFDPFEGIEQEIINLLKKEKETIDNKRQSEYFETLAYSIVQRVDSYIASQNATLRHMRAIRRHLNRKNRLR